MAKASKSDIASAVMGLIDGGASTEKIAKEVSAYLVSERRTKELDAIMRRVLELRAKYGVYEAEIASAHEIDSAIKSELKNLVKQNYPNAKEIIVHDSKDPSLVSGLVFGASELHLDLSARGKLRSLSQLITLG